MPPLHAPRDTAPDDMVPNDMAPLLAEREGFEPSVENKPYNCLAGSCLQPLGHLSIEKNAKKTPARATNLRDASSAVIYFYHESVL